MSSNLSGISVLCGQEHWPLWSVILHDQSSSNWKQDLHDCLITFTQNFISPAVSLLVLFIHIFILGFYFVEERWLILRHLIIFENFSDLKCNISRLQGQSRVLPSFSFLSPRPPSQSIVSKELKRHVSTLESFSSAGEGKTLVGTQAEEKTLSHFFLSRNAGSVTSESGWAGVLARVQDR